MDQVVAQSLTLLKQIIAGKDQNNGTQLTDIDCQGCKSEFGGSDIWYGTSGVLLLAILPVGNTPVLIQDKRDQVIYFLGVVWLANKIKGTQFLQVF